MYETLTAGLLGMLVGGMLYFVILLTIGLYVYSSLAFATIAKKAKLKTPNLAWIPFGVGPLIITYQAAYKKSKSKPWWLWLVLIALLVPVPFLNSVASIAFSVISIIWMWKTYEVVGRPGWWAILSLIPIVGLVMLGIAAWSKD